MKRLKRYFRKSFSMLMAALIILTAGAVTPVSALNGEDGWLIYCEKIDEESFFATIVVPAKYTRFSADAKIEMISTADPSETSLLTPSTGETEFYFNGKTERRLTMTVLCLAPGGSAEGYFYQLAVLPGSVLDDSGNGNARVFFDDLTEYLVAGGYADIDVYSKLLRSDYDRGDNVVAVGDTLRIDYSGLYPVEIYINGDKAASFPGGEMQRFTFEIVETGALDVTVFQGENVIGSRSMTVITSREMYERILRDGLISDEDIPSTDDLVDVGIPAGSPFIFAAKIVAFFVAVRDFFQRLFSFSRIAD